MHSNRLDRIERNRSELQKFCLQNASTAILGGLREVSTVCPEYACSQQFSM